VTDHPPQPDPEPDPEPNPKPGASTRSARAWAMWAVLLSVLVALTIGVVRSDGCSRVFDDDRSSKAGTTREPTREPRTRADQ
jgi:hypothetical protein